MEKKTGKNVSSGAEKVENAEKKAKRASAAKPRAQSAAKQTAAEKKERAAAEKRVRAAKEKTDRKERRLERRARLKEKRLERRAALAHKRAERKEKRLEKRAALKEKRVEKRAERIARREMLKNESRTEKHKRLEREKKERIALKRRRAEARDKARENKRKSREAAHARRADERKHKREQRTERRKRARGFGGWLAAVISLGVACLALATVVTAGAFRMNDLTVASENGARATLFEMVSVSEELDNNLTKLRVSSGKDEQRRLLTDILVDAALLETAIERIPVDAATGTDISAFVNKTNSYARKLLGNLAAGKSLGETESNTIGYLYEVNSQLYSELNELITHMSQKDFRAFLGGKEGAVSEGFGEMSQTSRRAPESEVDAPFSGEGNVEENRLDALEEVSSSKAEELVRGYLEGYHIRDARYTGETVSKEMKCYNFVLTDENGTEIYAQITKNGGKLAFLDTYEICTEKNFDLETCDSLAKSFLKELGVENAEAVWLSDGGMVADITYVSNDNNIRAYPDMIRVRVCESKGRVVGLDMKGYLLNYHSRELNAPLSEAEAREKLSSSLEAESGKLALIPLDGEERLAYEYECSDGNGKYLVYLDAETGEEIQMYRVRNSARGSYLR